MSLEPQEFNEHKHTELHNSTFIKYVDKAPLLHTSQLPTDEQFRGTVFVLSCSIRANIYEQNKFDGEFFMIDGDGVKFRAMFYGMEYKFESYQSSAYIEGIKYYRPNAKGDIIEVYRLSHIKQTSVNVPKALFMKEIPDYQKTVVAYTQNLALITRPELNILLQECNKYGLESDIKSETLTDTYGTQSGIKMSLYNKGCFIICALANGYNLDLELCYLSLLLKLWSPSLSVKGIDMSSEITNNYQLNKIIYSSALDDISKIKIIGILSNDNRSLESVAVNNTYNLLVDMIIKNDKLQLSVITKDFGIISNI